MTAILLPTMNPKQVTVPIIALSFTLLPISYASGTEPEGEIVEGTRQGGDISAREARAKTRLKAGGVVVRDKVEVYTKPGGGQFSAEEVTEILNSSAEEYGVTWNQDIVPAAGEAVGDLAEALGTTRKELEFVAKELAGSGKNSLDDAKYAIDQAKKEAKALADDANYAVGEARKELKTTTGDIEYALDASSKELEAAKRDIEYAVKNSSEDFNLVSGDLVRAGRQTRDDIKYALEVAGQGGGAVGAVASALGCTTEELIDVVQYFGKEAVAVFRDISSLPEVKDMKNGVTEILQDSEKMWISDNGGLVAALSGGGERVVIGQAGSGAAGPRKRMHWSSQEGGRRQGGEVDTFRDGSQLADQEPSNEGKGETPQEE